MFPVCQRAVAERLRCSHMWPRDIPRTGSHMCRRRSLEGPFRVTGNSPRGILADLETHPGVEPGIDGFAGRLTTVVTWVGRPRGGVAGLEPRPRPGRLVPPSRGGAGSSGALTRTRTWDLAVRSGALCPAELWGRGAAGNSRRAVVKLPARCVNRLFCRARKEKAALVGSPTGGSLDRTFQQVTAGSPGCANSIDACSSCPLLGSVCSHDAHCPRSPSNYFRRLFRIRWHVSHRLDRIPA